MVNTMKNITKREKFEAMKALIETGECAIDEAVLIEFCDKEIASLDAKAVKAKERQAAKKAEADALLDAVKATLKENEFQTIADVAAQIEDADATVAKITYRLTKLVEAGVAEKTEVSIAGADGGKARKVKAYRLCV